MAAGQKVGPKKPADVKQVGVITMCASGHLKKKKLGLSYSTHYSARQLLLKRGYEADNWHGS